MSPRIGGSPPPAVSRPTATTNSKATAPTASPPPNQPADSDYQSKKKKPVNMTGGFKAVAKLPPNVDPDLAKLVGSLRNAVTGGGPAATKATIAAALKKIGNDGTKAGAELAKLSPKERKAVWDALPAKVKDVAARTPTPAITMLQAQSMTDAQLKTAAADMRAGNITDPQMQLSIATELAARTKWGKADPDQVEKQREMVVSGKVSFANGRGAARTDENGTITLDRSLAKSPEALAATLAHEGTHAAHANAWGMMADYAEETSGNLASAQVWGEIGDPNDPNLTTNKRDSLNDYAEQFKAHGEDGVQARVVAEYTEEASKKGETEKVHAMIDELKKHPDAIKAMKPEYALEVAKALLRVPGADEAAVKDLGKAFKNLPASVRTEFEGLLNDKAHKFDADTRKVLVDAMNGK